MSFIFCFSIYEVKFNFSFEFNTNIISKFLKPVYKSDQTAIAQFHFLKYV